MNSFPFLALSVAAFLAACAPAYAQQATPAGLGASAVIRLNGSGESGLVPTAVDGEGKITVAATRTLDNVTAIVLSRYLHTGAPDPGFGIQGRMVLAEMLHCVHGPLLRHAADSSLVVIAGTSADPSCTSSGIQGWRITPAGTIDPSFRVTGLPTATTTTPQALITDGAGNLLLTALADVGTSGTTSIARLLPGGTADAQFGAAGRITLDEGPKTVSRGGRVALLPDGHLLTASLVGSLVQLAEWDSAGHPVPLPNGAPRFPIDFRLYAPNGETIRLVDFYRLADGANLVIVHREGVTGNALLIARTSGNLQGPWGTSMLISIGGPADWPVALPLSDASVIIAETTGAGAARTARLRRMFPDSSFDVTWGVGQAFAVGTTDVSISGLALDDAGRLLVVGSDVEGGWLRRYDMSLRPNYPKRVAVEFYNAPLGHYFITADPAESAAIDSGGAGPGWMRTGWGFYVHPVGEQQPVGSTAVCRFYGNRALNPATGRPYGPNSHVYVLDGAECAAVKRDPGWIYEGVVFHVYATQRFPQCAFWQTPIVRFYNNRAAQNDSNHRYVNTATGAYAQMLSSGWRPEGTVLCTP